MQPDDAIDRLLREALAAEMPQLSPGFDAAVRRKVRPRRLTAAGRVAVTLYFAGAAAASVWLMRDLPPQSILVSLLTSVPIAAGASAYGRRVAVGD